MEFIFGRGIQTGMYETGNSLFRQFQEKKDKACYKRDGPQAYFIECDQLAPSQPSRQSSAGSAGSKGSQRPKSAIEIVRKNRGMNNNNDVTTTIIDLETETLPKEKNLQEALKQKRPDYIAKTKTREQDRLARSMVSNKQNSGLNKPLNSKFKSGGGTSAFKAKSIYDPAPADGGMKRSKIPTKSGNVSNEQNGHSVPRSETVTLFSKNSNSRNSESRTSVTCQDVRRDRLGSAGSDRLGSASGGQTNAKKMAMNRSRPIKAFQ